MREKCIDIRIGEEYGVCNISFNPSHIKRPGTLKPVIAFSNENTSARYEPVLLVAENIIELHAGRIRKASM